jgi:O2-independent ubiquinone biosynthesis protein UbiV
MKLALGPIPYYWPRQVVLGYYRSVALSAVDVVYLGETVCSRRHEMRLRDWLDLAGMLSSAGKEVVLSTQALIESESDVKTLRRIAGNGHFLVEANDMGAVGLLESKAPFVAGPDLNVYNPQSLAFLASLGARRWVAPVEMPRASLSGMLRFRPQGVETEVYVYGRLPLALSARCFTARRFNLQKDDCQFRCLDHPEGLLVRTRDGRPFLVLNGTQTQSAGICNLVQELPGMAELGVDIVRIGPQSTDILEIARLFKHALKNPGEIGTPSEAGTVAAQLDGMTVPETCNGYWYGSSGIERVPVQPL